LTFEGLPATAGLFFLDHRDTLHGNGVANMIELQYEAPNEELTPFVSSFYRFDYKGHDLNEIERADRAQFRFMLNGKGHYRFAAGHERPTRPVTIIGPTTAPFESVSNEPLTIFGWGMTPAGWASLMGSAADKWVDEAFDARRVFGDAVMAVRQELASAEDIKAQFAIAQAAASEIFAKSDQAPFQFTQIVDQWLLADSDHEIAALEAATGLATRQLERTTKRYYGMPPKKLARKYRALLAAHKLAAGDSLDYTELGLSFYDQSHLIREIKQFTGLTPTQLKSGQSQLTAATMRERGKLAGKVSPLVSES
jgi:AraC-like DNA-binding protein